MDSNNTGLRRGVMATFTAKRDSLRRAYDDNTPPQAPPMAMAGNTPAPTQRAPTRLKR